MLMPCATYMAWISRTASLVLRYCIGVAENSGSSTPVHPTSPADPDPEPADGEQLRIGRKLDLDLSEDRQELIAACAPLPSLKKLVDENIDDFLRWFKAPEWHVVYDGGMMSGPEPRGLHSRMAS